MVTDPQAPNWGLRTLNYDEGVGSHSFTVWFEVTVILGDEMKGFLYSRLRQMTNATRVPLLV